MSDSPSPISTRERLFLTSIISITLAPKLAALGLPQTDQDYAIAFVAGAMPLVYHYGVEYLKYYLKRRHVPLPGDFDENPTRPETPASPHS
jgi:hypothetical protein